MKRLNKKGFTLIELLAVIVIMGILMLVAIPAITRYIENSKKDTYINTARTCIHAIRNLYNSDSIECIHRYDCTEWVNANSIENGKLYINFIYPTADSYWKNETAAKDGYGYPVENAYKMTEEEVKSPWKNNIAGLICIEVQNSKLKYKIAITDGIYQIQDSSPPHTKDINTIKRDSITKSSSDNRDWQYMRSKYANLDNEYCCVIK